MIDILDEDGYPTDDFLDTIERWDHKDGWNELLGFAMRGHIYSNYWHKEEFVSNTFWYISTGGWSGNESIINSLSFNQMFWMCCWFSSRRGGHHIFMVKRQTKGESK